MGAFTLVQFRSTTVPTACHHHQLFLLHILIMSLSSCKCRITYWHGWDITDCSWRNSQRAVQAHWCVLNGIILFLLQIPDRWSLTTVGDWPVHTMQLVGYELNWFLYGILLVQVCKLNRSVQYNILIHGLIEQPDNYNQISKSDSWKLKCLVYGVFLIETIQVILCSHDSFHELALNWGDPAVFSKVYYAWLTLPFMTGISTFTASGGTNYCLITYSQLALSSSASTPGEYTPWAAQRCWLFLSLWYVWFRVICKILRLTERFWFCQISLMQGSAGMAEGVQTLVLQNVGGTQSATYKTTIVRSSSAFLATDELTFLIGLAQR